MIEDMIDPTFPYSPSILLGFIIGTILIEIAMFSVYFKKENEIEKQEAVAVIILSNVVTTLIGVIIGLFLR